MRYLSVCSGIEAATAAWHHMGWQPAAFSEIEPFPSAVLAHHYPNVPNLGDMTKFKEWPDADVDVLVGGTPCQSFSVAGLRKGLDDPRGNLMLTYLAIAAKYRPQWLVWENVLGVLSSNGGLDFASLLRGMGELGYGFAYRVLDAQYFGVAQRRRRVFVVGCAGDWRAAAAVLFERHSLQGHPAPSRKAREVVAGGIEIGPGGGRLTDLNPTLDTRAKDGPIRNQLAGAVLHCADVAPTLNAHFGDKQGLENQHINGGGGCSLPPVSMCLNAGGMGRQDAETEALIPTNGGHFVDAIEQPVTYNLFNVTAPVNRQNRTPGDPCHTLARGNAEHAVVMGPVACDVADTLGVGANQTTGFKTDVCSVGMQVRRLTPRECERLQGFPDNFTAIPWRGKPAADCPDGPRYKALGNSMAVPVMRWIGERIQGMQQ
jgi:DNA (cytosine-5)-methyltransferase 1